VSSCSQCRDGRARAKDSRRATLGSSLPRSSQQLPLSGLWGFSHDLAVVTVAVTALRRAHTSKRRRRARPLRAWSDQGHRADVLLAGWRWAGKGVPYRNDDQIKGSSDSPRATGAIHGTAPPSAPARPELVPSV